MSLSIQYSVSAKSRPSDSEPRASMPPFSGALYRLLGTRCGVGLLSSATPPAGNRQSRWWRSKPTMTEPSGSTAIDSASWNSLPSSGRPEGECSTPVRASVTLERRPRSS